MSRYVHQRYGIARAWIKGPDGEPLQIPVPLEIARAYDRHLRKSLQVIEELPRKKPCRARS